MERKIGDIKDKKLKAENITLAAIYNILFTNDIVCSLIVEMLSELGSPDKPGGLSIQLCKSEKKEFYIRYSS